MALTKIKLDSFVSGNLSDANIPNNITIDTASAAPASGLTGNTLASGVTASSLTSVGTLTGLTTSGTVTVGASNGSTEVKVNRSRMRHIDGLADASDFSHGDLYVNHISTGNIYMQRDTTFAGNLTIPEFIYHSGDTDTFIRFTDNKINFVSGNSTALELGGTVSGNTIRGTNTFEGNIIMNGSSSRQIEFKDSSESEGAIVFDEITDGFVFKVGGTNSVGKTDAFKIENNGNATFTRHLTLDGVAHPILKLVGDPSGESTHIQLHRSNGQGFTIYDDQASLRFRADLSGSNPQMLQLKSDQSATLFGNQLFNPSWSTTNIAFGSDTSSFSAYNTGARIEVPLHATNGQAHGSFKFYTNSGDSAKYSLLLSEAGHVECQQKLYVVANYASQFGTELYNQSSTGHGTKIRGGSTSSHYALYVSNYDQTVALFSVMGDGSATLKSNFTAQGGVVDGDSGLKTQQAEFKRLTSNSFSNNNLHDLTQVHQRPFIVKVEDSAGGLSTMGFPIGGSGIAYNWSLFDSDSNTWTSNQATITSTGTSGNTYHFTFNTGSGVLRIQRTNGSLSFTVRVYQIAE